MRNSLNDRLQAGGKTDTARYRLDVRLDDRLEGLGLLSDDTIGRERRTLRARYQLFDIASGAILFDATEDWTLKASIGRAVRNPTVNELFQGGINTTTGLPTLNDPNLRPEGFPKWVRTLAFEHMRRIQAASVASPAKLPKLPGITSTA